MSAFKTFLTVAFFSILMGIPVQATTAAQVVPGYETVTACPGNIPPCFIQYGPSGATYSPAPYPETYLGHETAKTLVASTALVPTATATIADVVVEYNNTYSAPIRCLFDGTAPTSTTGMEFSPGATFRVVATDLTTVKCIQESASAAIDVQYGK